MNTPGTLSSFFCSQHLDVLLNEWGNCSVCRYEADVAEKSGITVDRFRALTKPRH